MSEWQPIETAPKDGTKIDVWVVFDEGGGKGRGAYRETDVRWNAADRAWVREIRNGEYTGENDSIEWSVKTHVVAEMQHHWASEMDRAWTITHWMPLPEPPPERGP